MDELLTGGNMTPGVVRVGDTVRRPRGAGSDFAAELLALLASSGCAWAPRHLGVDEQGRDMLAYVPGAITTHPAERDERAYRAFGAMLRELHEATRGSALAGAEECVVHGDTGPFNAIVRDGMPVALIDWDAAHPGPSAEDVGYAGWTWCVSADPRIPIADQARRLAELVAGYGDASLGPARVLEVVEAAQTGLVEHESAIAADPTADDARREHARRAVAWAAGDRDVLRGHRATFIAALGG